MLCESCVKSCLLCTWFVLRAGKCIAYPAPRRRTMRARGVSMVTQLDSAIRSRRSITSALEVNNGCCWSFDSALAATLQDLKLTFSLRKEQRTALKSFLKNKYVFGVFRVPIQGLHPSKDASFEGCSLRRPRRLHRRPNERCGMGRSSLRSISGLRHQPLTSFTLRDHALLLSPSNPDSCVSNRTAEEKYGARNIYIFSFSCFIFYWSGRRFTAGAGG